MYADEYIGRVAMYVSRYVCKNIFMDMLFDCLYGYLLSLLKWFNGCEKVNRDILCVWVKYVLVIMYSCVYVWYRGNVCMSFSAFFVLVGYYFIDV